MKSVQLINYIKKLFAPTCNVLLHACCGFVFISICTIIILNLKDFTALSTDKKLSKTDLIGITDVSKFDINSINKELSQIKDKEKYLEFMLFKMNSQVTNLQIYQKNKDNELPDFASESAGGFIISTPDTIVFSSNTYASIFGIPLWKINNYSPKKIIQPWTQAGECWPFKGHYGKIEIHLAHLANLESVTLEHIPITASLTGSIDSAPKNFRVHGYFKQQYNLLGLFTYNIDGNPSQTFIIKDQEMRKLPIKKVLLEVISNWGNPEYTCIYRFKVHGKIFKLAADKPE